jgi:hypothetical protein
LLASRTEIAMPLTERSRRQLVSSLYELHYDKPIDNPQIERALIAAIEALLEMDAQRDVPGDELPRRWSLI